MKGGKWFSFYVLLPENFHPAILQLKEHSILLTNAQLHAQKAKVYFQQKTTQSFTAKWQELQFFI